MDIYFQWSSEGFGFFSRGSGPLSRHCSLEVCKLFLDPLEDPPIGSQDWYFRQFIRTSDWTIKMILVRRGIAQYCLYIYAISYASENYQTQPYLRSSSAPIPVFPLFLFAAYAKCTFRRMFLWVLLNAVPGSLLISSIPGAFTSFEMISKATMFDPSFPGQVKCV